MASEYRWYDEGHIIYARIMATVTIDDLQTGNNAISKMLDQVAPTAKVHIIFDITDMTQMAIGLKDVRNYLYYFSHPALDSVILCGGTGLLQTMAQLLGSMFVAAMHQKRFRVFDNLGQALAFLDIADRNTGE